MKKMKTSQKIYLPFKRIIDILGSIVGILFCFIFLWWWTVVINSFITKGHPFFKSLRVGKNGKKFNCLKFRSMSYETNPYMTSHNKKVPNQLTNFGRFLRKSSIDETPQLFNILVGQMSFVGPRPLIDVAEDSITNAKRNENGSIVLRPGLTGYAQIHKRGELDAIEKANYDGYYYDKLSFILDCKIFVYTIFGLFGNVKGR